MGSCVLRQKKMITKTKPQRLTDVMNNFKVDRKLMSAEARNLIYEIKDSKAPVLNLLINPLYLKRIVKKEVQYEQQRDL
ncbi:hypothetical protein SteCoe_2508 [Stentor coeruleus]|uniref:Uncharacterized protein n=1 Tax=Stentor coeruleus TaxID=5963 RepID=A0A1R2CZB1_9CILI|nr:hypothetical protein SteCoe_2508 [Stentor coeruleus]